MLVRFGDIEKGIKWDSSFLKIINTGKVLKLLCATTNNYHHHHEDRKEKHLCSSKIHTSRSVRPFTWFQVSLLCLKRFPFIAWLTASFAQEPPSTLSFQTLLHFTFMNNPAPTPSTSFITELYSNKFYLSKFKLICDRSLLPTTKKHNYKTKTSSVQ